MEDIIKRDPARVFEKFRERITSEVYSEPDTQMHTTIINQMVSEFIENYLRDKKDDKILDVGCGQGYACLRFKEAGYENIIAITLSDEDVKATRDRGFECYKMDMSFLCFSDKTFDVLWVRHTLEHSPYPYLTLLEFNRVLKDKGKAYIEMPKANTPRTLEHWPNHYSIFGVKMWASLFARSGFNIPLCKAIWIELQSKDINNGKPFKEEYYVFVIEKAIDQQISL